MPVVPFNQYSLYVGHEMRICIPITTKTSKALVSLRFARSEYFAIVDQQLSNVEYVENPYLTLNRGVGNKLLNWLLSEYRVDAVLAFELGLKVQQIANEHHMQLIIISEKKQSLKQLLGYMGIES